MRWHDAKPRTIRGEEVAGVYAEIELYPCIDEGHYLLRVLRGGRLWMNERWHEPEFAKKAALRHMRAAVIAARDEAHNAVLDASRWLRANGGEP